MAETHYVAGIDMGGTNTPFGIVAPDGTICGRGHIPTRCYTDVREYADALHAAVMEVFDSLHLEGDLTAVGMGTPCANTATGCIEGATDIPWPSPVPMAELLRERFSLPSTILNDADAATAGERAYGVARGLDNFIMLTLGTGVGSSIVCDGHQLGGSQGFAGELGHVVVDFASDRPCGCGRKGCLQTYCSASGVVTTARRLLDSDKKKSSLAAIDPDTLTPLIIFEAAERGDVLALETFRYTGEVLGRACANFAAYSDPEAFVLFGGVAGAAKFMLPAIRGSFRESALFLYRDRVRFLCSTMSGSDAAILGAAARAFDLSHH